VNIKIETQKLLILNLMARRKLEDKSVRKLTRMGKGSIGLTLLIEIIKELKLRE